MSGGNEDIDERSSMLFSTTTETLSAASNRWPRPGRAPQAVQDMLLRSRRHFVGAAHTYDDFVAAELAALQAVELALRDLLGIDSDSKATFGVIARSEAARTLLTEWQFGWFNEYAVHFRNDHAHPKRATAVAPGQAERLVRSVHQMICDLYLGR